MRRAGAKAVLVAAILLMLLGAIDMVEMPERERGEEGAYREISGTVERGETLFTIFMRSKLDRGELFRLREASASVHRLRELYPGQPYKIVVDDDNQVHAFMYWIDDDHLLDIRRSESGFSAEKKAIAYERRVLQRGASITNNLISSLGETREDELLALRISDIFAWDIDFSTDLQPGDSLKIVVEGLYREGIFRKYGDILAAEMANAGTVYRAYRFERNGAADYYDAGGRPLKRAFLKAPLSFRRISSGFSRSRLHPVLKIYRPHHGIDYAAPAGAPVSAVGDGTIAFAGRKGQYGNLVIVRHRNGFETCYGHLSGIEKGIRKGVRVGQGAVLGYVGATGLATGPHLHYEIRRGGRPVDPLRVDMPRGETIPRHRAHAFSRFRDSMERRFASIAAPLPQPAQGHGGGDSLFATRSSP
ncbi:MAG: M23 family metallopeptidase [Nitrospirota bacterium]